MSDLNMLLEMDWKNGILFIAAIVVVAVWAIQKWEFICEKFGIKTKRSLREEEERQDIETLKQHAKKTDENIDKIMGSITELKETVNRVSSQIIELKDKVDENERSKTGDRLTQAYNYYRKLGKWTQIQKWAFDAMVASYKNANGDGWIDDVVIPTSKTWEIVDENEM